MLEKLGSGPNIITPFDSMVNFHDAGISEGFAGVLHKFDNYMLELSQRRTKESGSTGIDESEYQNKIDEYHRKVLGVTKIEE